MAHAGATTLDTAAPAAATDSDFVWRRLHSLSGVVPLGAFLAFHTFENLSALKGQAAYDHTIGNIADLLPKPYFYALELFGIVLPLLFHAFYGVWVAMHGRANTGRYGYRSNLYYLLQRVSGAVALLYIALHVGVLRIGYTLLGNGSGLDGHPGYVSWFDVKTHLANNAVFAAYAVGILATVFHLANGLNGFCWSFGIAVGDKSRKAVEYASWAVFVALAVPALNILISFR